MLPRASARGFYMGSPYGTFSFLKKDFRCGDVDVSAPSFDYGKTDFFLISNS